jgi:pyocin large subunit-like protein
MHTRFAKPLAAAFLCAGLLLPAAGARAFSLGGLFGSPVDAELAAQVPQDKRAAINAADYELACANQDVELAKLKEELADKQDDVAALGTKLAKSQARGAEIRLDIAKMEGIIANKLGKDEENQKILADLKNDRSKNESETISYKAKIDTATLYVRDWTQRVANKEKSVAEFKSRRSGGASTAPTASPAAAQPASAKTDTAAPAAGDDATVIINKEPGAAPEKPAATPEADLNN